MRSIVASSAFIALYLFAASVAAVDPCANVATKGANVVTWTGKCQDIMDTANCWTPSNPTAASTAVIPAGTTAHLAWVNNSQQAVTFAPFAVTNFVIESGATLNAGGQAIQTTGCFLVQGTLVLNSGMNEYLPWNQNVTSQGPATPYLPDPAQPEGTDCPSVQTGFTPRICGPGKLSVSGTLNVMGLYSSVFQSGTIEASGSLNLQQGGFIWGNISVHGTYVQTGYTYQHGYLYVYGTANMSTIAFDVWATSYTPRTPLLIENFGTINFIDAFLVPTYATYYSATKGASEGTYRAVLVNYGQAAFLGEGGQSNWEFDVFNYGNLMWSYTWMYQFFGGGTFVNKGTITVNTASVFLSTFHSIGGSIVLVNGGVLNFGSSSSSASATMKLCQLTQGMPSDLQAAFAKNSRRRTLAARHMHSEAMVEQRGDCWWYGDFCYHSPYIWNPPVDVATIEAVAPKSVDPSGLPLKRHGGTVRLRVQQLIAESEMSVETPCSVRYSVEATSITGDGSGSIVANLPVRVTGTLQLKAGAKWYVAAERRGAPFYGGGKVVVRRGATLFAGISADFKHDGSFEVQRGGQFAVPRHASVVISNHTFVLHPGSNLHVDGKLVLAEAKGAKMSLDLCGLVDGVGEVIMEKEGMLRCSAEKRKDDLLERLRLPRRHH